MIQQHGSSSLHLRIQAVIASNTVIIRPVDYFFSSPLL